MSTQAQVGPEAEVSAERGPEGTLTLALSGRLDADTTPSVWRRAVGMAAEAHAQRLVVSAEAVTYCDGAGIALILELQRLQAARGGECLVEGLAPEFAHLLHAFDVKELQFERYRRGARRHIVVRTGQIAAQTLRDLYEQVTFAGHLLVALGSTVRHPRHVRWKDLFLVVERVGADGLPIVLLVGFLMGLVMSFQAAMILRMFGLEVFVARMIALVVVRELGPLVTAVVVAGRSGSSFAAEIGTMEFNDEVNAIRTMGLDPARLLATNRVIAAVAMMPALTLFFDLASILGGMVVMTPLGIPMVTYVNQVLAACKLKDVFGGLFKSLVLGLLVAAIGCLRGFQTRRSASGVGEATTSAVVSAIILIAIAEGVFAVLYYHLGL